jgi:hypothetical protein
MHSEIPATKRHKSEEILNNNNNQMLDGMHSNTQVLKRMDNNNYDDPEVVTLSAPEQEMVKEQNPNSANLFVINIGMYSVIWKHAKQLKQSKNTWPSQNGQVQND